MSVDKDMVDSRTHLVGRKRFLEDVDTPKDLHRDRDSEDDESLPFNKRAKRDEMQSEGEVQPGISVKQHALNTITQDLLPQAVNPQSKGPPGWNKGVQAGGGLRTSFGTRTQSRYASAQGRQISGGQGVMDANTKTQPPEAVAEKIVGEGFDRTPDGEFESRVSVSRSGFPALDELSHGQSQNVKQAQRHSPLALAADDSNENRVKVCAIDNQLAHEQTHDDDSHVDSNSTNREKALQSSEPDMEGALQPSPHQQVITQPTLAPMSRKQRKQAKKMESISSAETSVTTQAKTTEKEKFLSKAARKREFEAGTNSERNVSRFKCATHKEKMALDPKVRKFYEDLLAEQRNLKTQSPNIPYSGMSTTVEEPEDSQLNEDENAICSGADQQHKQTPTNPLEILTAREVELQQRYFPVADGILRFAHCLACMSVDHATTDCLLLSCETCGEESDHPYSSCPRAQRCGRCRYLGHGSTECPEKLARIGDEAIPCDLCGSSDHVENQCQLIWRSFTPLSKDVLQIQSLLIDCYTCGQSGHFGPDCGLYQGHGNVTWSRSNYDKYVNPNSLNQGVFVESNFALPFSAKVLNTNGKGAVQQLIDSSESDDDMSSFIQAKVKNPSRQRGKIQLGNLQAPSGPRGNQAREVRSGLAHSPHAPIAPSRNTVDSGRYARERTFSPPPRFDSHADFVAFDRSAPNYSSRNRPPIPETSYQKSSGPSLGLAREGAQIRGHQLPPKPTPTNRSGGKGRGVPKKPGRTRARGGR